MTTEYVAFDLETTGLDTDTDAIIEIGAVRFSRDGVIDSFQTFVNPYRAVPQVVQNLTHIRQADLAAAPPIEAVAGDFERFIAGSILVGQNICGFDVPVLDSNGVRHPVHVYDTQRLAEILLPAHGRYGLADLAEHFEIDFPVQHRALEDADACRLVFLRLLEHAGDLPAEVVSQVAQWLTPTAFPWRNFFREAWELCSARAPAKRPIIRPPNNDGLRPLKPRTDPVAVPGGEPMAVLNMASRRADIFPGFDERAEQVQMLEAVRDAVGRKAHLMVEAGTGTGKSLAYLIPAACEAAANSTRAVISTSTINLQEQLTKKDIPAVQALMGDGVVRACQLKGRRNYLCLRRFNALRMTPTLTDDEAYLASKVLVWLGETETGDRGELRLSREEEAVWWRISADGAECSNDNSPFVVDGTCFLQRARRTAEASHVVVVNHALLLSDIATGGRVVPPYQHLVVDEAHHLEDEATRQFGFTCREKDLLGLIERCEHLVPAMEAALRSAPVMLQARQQLAAVASATREAARAAKPHFRTLCDTLSGFLRQHAPTSDEQKLHITRAMRVQPDWPDVEIAWDNARLGLGELGKRLDSLSEQLRSAEQVGMLNHELVLAEAANCLSECQETATGLAAAIEQEDPQRVVWIETDRSDGGVIASWVPLDVSGLLQDGLYTEGRSVVLTGATLRTQGGFSYLQQRLGLEDCETLALGSPFDYRRQAVVVIPRDMPDPQSPQFLDALGRSIVELARASRGRALVLFTSHSMLRAAHNLVAAPLLEDGITALAQGVDGSPRQLVRALKSDPKTVILGTSSFWEGVDIPGDNLSLLVIARLPFAVPTDPVFAARSAQYEDSFGQFALPMAVLRFKQGFGRLIRSRTDRGVVAVLDQRVVNKEYGRAFLESLPGCPIRPMMMRDMPDAVETFLAQPVAAG